jgi:AcrR family transcriptional regulator
MGAYVQRSKERREEAMGKQGGENQCAKSRIAAAYFALLRQYGVKDSENISITEITAQANVSRMAYYRNFHRKTEIIEFYFRDSLWHSFQAKAKGLSFWSYEYGVQFFSVLKENRDIILLLDEHGYSGVILDSFNEKNEELVGDMPHDDIRRFNLYYAAGGSFNGAMIWLKEGCRETPEQMARSFLGFVGRRD